VQPGERSGSRGSAHIILVLMFGSRNRLPLLTLAIIPAVIILAGCGDSTAIATVEESAAGSVAFSVVVNGSPDAISNFETEMKAGAPSGQLNGVTITTVSGDHHTGTFSCQTDTKVDNFTVHVSVYSASAAIGVEICNGLENR
jgi:hypothetical protein